MKKTVIWTKSYPLWVDLTHKYRLTIGKATSKHSIPAWKIHINGKKELRGLWQIPKEEGSILIKLYPWTRISIWIRKKITQR